MDEFLIAFGRFILSYSHAERALKILTIQAAGIRSEGEGLAVFGAMRVSVLQDSVRRLYEAREAEIPSDLIEVFAQFKHINAMRDKLVHHGWGWSSTHGLVTTSLKDVYHESKAATFPVSARALHEMTEDLQRIHHDLILISVREFDPSEGQRNVATSIVDEGQAAPWLYKPPQPIARASKRPKSPPE